MCVRGSSLERRILTLTTKLTSSLEARVSTDFQVSTESQTDNRLKLSYTHMPLGVLAVYGESDPLIRNELTRSLYKNLKVHLRPHSSASPYNNFTPFDGPHTGQDILIIY